MKSYILQCKNNRVFFSFFFGLLFFIICQTSPLGENLKSLCVEVLYFNKSHGRSPPNVMEGSDFSFFLSSLSFSKSRCFVGDRDAFQGTDLSSRIARTRVSQGYLFVCHTPNKQHVGGLIALHRALCLVIPPQPGRFFFFFFSPAQLHNSARTMGTPTMIEHNDV